MHILEVPSATLELANPQQIAFIDRVEVGVAVGAHLPAHGAHRLRGPGCGGRRRGTGRRAARSRSRPPTETPWRSLNARLEAPGGMQVTAFQELGPA